MKTLLNRRGKCIRLKMDELGSGVIHKPSSGRKSQNNLPALTADVSAEP